VDTLRIGARESLQIETRPGEKLPSLTPGEVVRARVVEIMPGGDALLRVKGSLIQAKSDLQLAADTMVLFRVTEVKGEKGAQQIRFQLIETLPDAKLQGGPGDAGFAAIRELVRELAALLTVKGQRPTDFTAAIERLLKTLPDDAARLPKDLRGQILTLLQTSLRNTEQNIQNRLNLVLSDPWLRELPEWLESLAATDELFAGVDELPEIPFKSLLENTGVALEAKLRAFAGSLSEDAGGVPEATPSELEASVSPEAALLRTDLKGRLLELRQRILDSLEQGEAGGKPPAEVRGGHGKDAGAAQARALEALDGLLQDIETFQLLSKLTDSFYTFLPLVWEGLREAEIAFKKSRGGGRERSYYCLVQLDFGQLGKLTILALKQDQDFFISFEAEHEPLRTVLKQNVSDLEAMFRESGLNLKAADFHGTKEKHLAPFEQLESFESILSVKI
jgi:hypothetical protein